VGATQNAPRRSEPARQECEDCGGACECGKVTYRVDDSFLYALNCHCSRCRAATGSAFKPLAGIDREGASCGATVQPRFRTRR
jgi:hypothetical protein